METNIPKQLTKKEALDKGYILCGYANKDAQHLMNIADLNEIDFTNDEFDGVLVVANPQPHSACISREEVKEWLVDRYFSHVENPDDSNDMENFFCEPEAQLIIADFVFKINEIYAKKQWYYLNENLILVPDEK